MDKIQEAKDRKFAVSILRNIIVTLTMIAAGTLIMLGLFALGAYARDPTCLETYTVKAIVDCALG